MLGTVARTAVVASTAQAAAGRVHRNQQQRWSQQDAAAQAQAAPLPPPPAAPVAAPAEPAATGMEDKLALLQQLGSLRDQGILTDAEFDAKKSQILAS
jgi:hypothetical protein